MDNRISCDNVRGACRNNRVSRLVTNCDRGELYYVDACEMCSVPADRAKPTNETCVCLQNFPEVRKEVYSHS